MGWIVTSAPATEILTTSETKGYLKVDTSADDTLIGNMVKAMRQHAEQYLGQALITQTIEEKIDTFPATNEFFLGAAPVQSITSIQYVDTDGATQTWDSANYILDAHRKHARITPAYATTWPSVRAQTNAITITYVAGYGDNVTDVPETIREAILAGVADRYDNREDYVKQLPTVSQWMLDAFIYQLG